MNIFLVFLWTAVDSVRMISFWFCAGGFIYVDDLLNYNDLRGYSPEDVRRVVAENDKKRFYLAEDPETGRLKVRANQGHTFEVRLLFFL